MSWARHEGRALADTTLSGEALRAALEDHIRAQNPSLTDVRLEGVNVTEEYDAGTSPAGRWYSVTYLADDGLGY
ncbi:hypothetical protein ACOJVU_11895 [Mycobacterium sp. THU-M104]|uniref:hypothetical protein n=1 Tax=Mycobacterium sp. THU-M104 TaxID=3410515 RepID=UPI003B9A0600